MNMKFLVSSLLLYCIFITSAYSADPEPTLALKLVTEKCQFCHGLNGEASSVIYPRLAGQNKLYLEKQLNDFKSGKRQIDPMNEIAAALTAAEITVLAEYFNGQPIKSHRVRNKELAAVGKYIFNKGNQYSGIAACASCHGENGEGSELRPRLAGQHKRYVSEQLNEFTKRSRTNDNAIMYSISQKLTELEIEAVALYVSGL